MPEVLHPGVFVEEYGDRSKPIPGVLTSTADLLGLGSELRQIVLRYQPDWSDRGASDPGVTLIEVLAWISELLAYRLGEIPEAGRDAAIRCAAALAALSRPAPPAGAPLIRPSFYPGQLLDAATLRAEQDYHREALRRHNLALHGVGIVSGLEVHVEDGAEKSEARVRVNPGYAIDPRGQEIALACSAAVVLPQTPAQVYVSIRHQDVPSTPVPTADGGSVFSRIEEACTLCLVDTVAEHAIALARLSRSGGAWQVDRSFAAPRASRDC